jgi:hypothetical protein
LHTFTNRDGVTGFNIRNVPNSYWINYRYPSSNKFIFKWILFPSVQNNRKIHHISSRVISPKILSVANLSCYECDECLFDDNTKCTNSDYYLMKVSKVPFQLESFSFFHYKIVFGFAFSLFFFAYTDPDLLIILFLKIKYAYVNILFITKSMRNHHRQLLYVYYMSELQYILDINCISVLTTFILN